MIKKTAEQKKAQMSGQGTKNVGSVIVPSDFTLVTSYNGYRNKEDITNLPPGYLVVGSQNILTTTGGRFGVRKGYTLDGQADTTMAAILASFDWQMHTGTIQHLRAGNSKLQFRYVATGSDYYLGTPLTAGEVLWIDLDDATGGDYFRFADFWDDTKKQALLMMVNGTDRLWQWTGGVTTFAGAYNTAIKITGNSASLTSYAGTSSNTAQSFYINGLAGTSLDGSIVLTAQPANNDTLTITVNGTDITITFVSVIGATAGNVLIGATLADTVTNLLGLLQNPGTTNTTQVALSAGNQTLIGYETYAATKVIVKQGTNTWAEDGFYTDISTTQVVVINGTKYAVSAGYGTLALTGVASIPTGVTVGELVIENIGYQTNSQLTSNSLVKNDLIANYRNQIILADTNNRDVLFSKVNDYTNYSFSTPRAVGEGALVTLDANPVGIIAQEDGVYITAGKDLWYKTSLTLSSDNTKEILSIDKLKTSNQQAAQSQELIAKIKNSVVFVTNEPTFDELGRDTGTNTQSPGVSVEGGTVINLATPQSGNISDPIKNDFDVYDFTDGQVFYYRNFIYISVPKEGKVLIYNMNKKYWEAPQLMPISRFSIIDGLLYGHSYQSPETFKLFDGFNDNGNPIEATALFSYQNYGTRSQTKDFDEYYVEGYISGNTENLTCGINYETDGFITNIEKSISGTDPLVAQFGSQQASIGKSSIGKNTLGGLNENIPDSLPPKFRIIFTLTRYPFYEVQFYFSTIGVDYQWEILGFGALARRTEAGNNNIKV